MVFFGLFHQHDGAAVLFFVLFDSVLCDWLVYLEYEQVQLYYSWSLLSLCIYFSWCNNTIDSQYLITPWHTCRWLAFGWSCLFILFLLRVFNFIERKKILRFHDKVINAALLCLVLVVLWVTIKIAVRMMLLGWMLLAWLYICCNSRDSAFLWVTSHSLNIFVGSQLVNCTMKSTAGTCFLI